MPAPEILKLVVLMEQVSQAEILLRSKNAPMQLK
jgi:hypothetical protein